MLLALLLLGCPHAPPVEVAAPAQAPVQFAIHSRAGTLAGTGLVTTRGDGVDLIALTPVGVELFQVSVRGEVVEVSAADPDWAEVLARLPWGRDLGLLHQWRCAERCAVPGGGTVMRESPETVRYRGPGGPARVERVEGRTTLRDPRRAYTLVVVGGAHGP